MSIELYDVVVVGGGSAGINAAIQAGRMGVKTLLIEKNGILGGTTTVGGVNFPGLFHAWKKQIIKGIGWELVEKCINTCGDKMPDFSLQERGQHWREQVLINKAIYSALCDEFLIDAGTTILFHTLIADIKDEENLKNITICTKTGLQTIKSKIIIDCTADANCASIAGYEINIHKTHQPATLVCQASGYNVNDINFDKLKEEYEKNVSENKLLFNDISWSKGSFSNKWILKYGSNANHIFDINAFDSQGKSKLEIEGRKSLLRLYRFLKTQKGFENLTIDYVSNECGVRETANIIGKKTVTHQDYTSGKVWEDAISYSFYPIDLHQADATGVSIEPLQEGVVPTIPRGAMLPKNSTNFLVAGRCISSDRLANSALRIQASCMAMGQAAGVMASLSARNNIEVSQLKISEIHQHLVEHNAIVPEIK
ncbi:MAG: FAD-dependent oxidoreductase [Planctomycetota bacterium]|nr:MAG: FAD-dependent oxidoreductase [Planctomycetota bacterium]